MWGRLAAVSRVLALASLLVLGACGKSGAVESSPVSACAAVGGECVWKVCSAIGSQDCGPGEGQCCLDAVNASTCATDGAVPTILASNYDGTCMVDSDCVAAGVGNPCGSPCEVFCRLNAAINRSSLAQYNADVARIPATFGGCFCPVSAPPCCNFGTCGLGCPVGGDAGTATTVTDASPVVLDTCDACK